MEELLTFRENMSGVRLEVLFQECLVALMSHNHKGREPGMCLLLRPAG